MHSRFTKAQLYEELFSPKDSDEEIFDDLADEFWNGIDASWVGVDHRPVRVLSVGFGSGRLDIPLIESLYGKIGSHKPVEITAIEPNWVDGYRELAVARLNQKGWSPVQRESTTAYQKSRMALTVSSIDIEDWVHEQSSPPPSYDVILCLFTIHLVTDLKWALGFLLSYLSEKGVIVLSENFGSIVCIDGQFSDAKGPNTNATWVRLWKELFELRDRMLLPRIRIATPRNLDFLVNSISKMTTVVKHDSEPERVFEKQIGKTALTNMIHAVGEGAGAQTFGSLRVHSQSDARYFSDQATGMIEHAFEQLHGRGIEYEVGVRLIAFQNQAPSPPDPRRYLNAVAETVAEQTSTLGLPLRSSIKLNLSREDGVSPVTTRPRQRALHAALHGLRESAALSRNSILILNARRGQSYVTAQTLLPELLLSIWTTQEERDEFFSIYALYVAGEPQFHMSRLLQPDMTKWLSDFTIRVVFSNGNDERTSPLDIQWEPTVDGYPGVLQVVLPPLVPARERGVWDDLLRKWKKQIPDLKQFIKPEGTSEGKEPWMKWKDVQSLREYVVQHTVGRQLLDFLRRRCQDEVWTQQVDSCLKTKMARFTGPVGEREACEETLTKIIYHSLRVQLFGDPLPWRELILSVTASPYPEKAEVSTGVFFLLTESDAQAYNWNHFRSRRRSCFRDTPPLLSHFQPWKAAFQDIEISHFAIQSAEAAGRKAELLASMRVKGHERAKLYAGLLDLTEPSFLANQTDARKALINEFCRTVLRTDDLETVCGTGEFSQLPLLGEGGDVREAYGTLCELAWKLHWLSQNHRPTSCSLKKAWSRAESRFVKPHPLRIETGLCGHVALVLTERLCKIREWTALIVLSILRNALKHSANPSGRAPDVVVRTDGDQTLRITITNTHDDPVKKQLFLESLKDKNPEKGTFYTLRQYTGALLELLEEKDECLRDLLQGDADMVKATLTFSLPLKSLVST